MRRLWILLLFFSSLAGWAQNYDKGIIIDTVFCSANHAQSYALYLPSNYQPDKQWPIIYIFEPAARGALPLNIFQNAAEELGYIVVSSNNSKNGDWSVVFEAARAMKKDTEFRFNIDKKRVYTAGFSGGSRAAMVMAKSVYKATGIIANAGAYPSKIQYLIKRKDSISYAAIVGNRDMNYLEHKELARYLTDEKVDNLLLISNDPHQWASSKDIYLALKWMELKTNRNLSLIKEKEILNGIKIWGDSTLNQPEFIYTLPFLQNMSDESSISFLKNPDELVKTKLVQKQLKMQQRVEAKEDQQTKNYREAFSTLYRTQFDPSLDSIHTKGWWKGEIDNVKKKEGSEKKYVALSATRMSNFLWASFAELSFSYKSKGDYDLALELNGLWRYAQPESAWVWFSQAKLYMKMGDKSAAIKALYRAKEYGLVKKESILNQPEFKELQEVEDFKIFISQLE